MKKHILLCKEYYFVMRHYLFITFGVVNIKSTIIDILSEYIDYHLSSEPSVTQSPTYPKILSRFEMNGEPFNVTAQIASTVSLHCVIRNLNNKTVRKYNNKISFN